MLVHAHAIHQCAARACAPGRLLTGAASGSPSHALAGTIEPTIGYLYLHAQAASQARSRLACTRAHHRAPGPVHPASLSGHTAGNPVRSSPAQLCSPRRRRRPGWQSLAAFLRKSLVQAGLPWRESMHYHRSMPSLGANRQTRARARHTHPGHQRPTAWVAPGRRPGAPELGVPVAQVVQLHGAQALRARPARCRPGSCRTDSAATGTLRQ